MEKRIGEIHVSSFLSSFLLLALARGRGYQSEMNSLNVARRFPLGTISSGVILVRTIFATPRGRLIRRVNI